MAFETAITPALETTKAMLEPAQLERLIAGLAHYRGDLLLGWYENWVLCERERLQLLCLRVFSPLDGTLCRNRGYRESAGRGSVSAAD